MESFTPAERASLAASLRAGTPPYCPHCNSALSQQPVTPRNELSYVRHRIWLLCPACKRSASVDVPR